MYIQLAVICVRLSVAEPLVGEGQVGEVPPEVEVQVTSKTMKIGKSLIFTNFKNQILKFAQFAIFQNFLKIV